MADKRKSNVASGKKSGKKSGTDNKKNTKVNSAKKTHALPAKEGMRKEVLMLIMVAFAVLLYAFLLLGSSNGAGIVGKIMADILLGILGVGAWILPTLLIVGAVYLAIEKDRTIFKIRACFSAAFFLVIVAFIHGFGGSSQYEGLSITEFIAYSFRHGAVTNGGLIGALLYYGLYKLVGVAGTYIILTLVGIIMVMLISGGSLVGLIRKIKNLMQNIKENYIDYYEEYDEEYDDGYDDEIESEPRYETKKRERRQSKNTESKSNELNADATMPHDSSGKVLAVDIKKGEKKDSKISIIATEMDDDGTEKTFHDSESDRLTRLMDMFESRDNISDTPELKAHELQVDLPSDNFNVDEGVSSSFGENTQTHVEKNIDVKSEDDTPPWEEKEKPYSTAEEPEIIAAEKTKLVDKLETEKKKSEYKFPKLSFLGINKHKTAEKTKDEILQKAKKLEDTLAIFKVEAKVDNISIGPTVTRYELTPSKGTKVSAVTNLENDIKFAMAAESIIIEAPIPGKSAIGIEIPNDTRESVYFSEVLRSEQFQKFKSKIAFGLGKDITGSVVVADLAKMPHLLVAGTTGSGKSVCINTIIMSILYKATPDEVKMIMVDPKMVELSVYNNIPHLLLPVVTEPEKAAGALNWAVIEMERRYKLLAKTGTRNLEGYNQKVSSEEQLSQIVIIIDELADLMMVVGKEIETSICRLAQKARAAGMHLVLATQRPSADVLTGLIRSNVPSRIAFKVSGSMDSRIILDSTGAEKLLGKGDMLFKTSDMPKPMRIQGAFITDDEVERVVNYIKVDDPVYDEVIIKEINNAGASLSSGSGGNDGEDPLTEEVLSWIVNNPKCASAGKVQRNFRIGFNRASRIIEDLESRGILGPSNGSQPREVLMDKYELRERNERYSSYND